MVQTIQSVADVRMGNGHAKVIPRNGNQHLTVGKGGEARWVFNIPDAIRATAWFPADGWVDQKELSITLDQGQGQFSVVVNASAGSYPYAIYIEYSTRNPRNTMAEENSHPIMIVTAA